MNEVRIPYKPNPLIFLFATLFFGAAAGGMSYAAITNDRGLILNGIISLSEQGATRFYWGVAGTALAFVITGLAVLIRGMSSPKEICISDTKISAPKSAFSNTCEVITYMNITNVSVQTIQGTRLLHIDHQGGRLSIPGSMLPTKRALDDLETDLKNRIQGL